MKLNQIVLLETDNVSFLESLQQDELNVILQKVLDGIRFSADRHASSNLRALKVQQILKDDEQQAINDWVKAGAPLPVISGFEVTSQGPYNHQGEEFMSWVKQYTSDKKEEWKQHQDFKEKHPEKWNEYIDKYLEGKT